jgi:hypothetical protein
MIRVRVPKDRRAAIVEMSLMSTRVSLAFVGSTLVGKGRIIYPSALLMGKSRINFPQPNFLGLGRCEEDFATAIGLLNTAPWDFIESAIEMSAACCRVGVPRSSGLEVRDRFVDLLP